jgi:putative membrane protein
MKIKKSFGIALRGLAMGAADVVPGVSGGTIAFITGIYDVLLDSINSFNFGLIKTLKDEGFKSFWGKINGSFLLPLFIGIGISVASLAELLGHFLQVYPHQLWSFFFGLIMASILYIGKQIPKINLNSVLGVIMGTLIVLGVSMLPPLGSSQSLFYIFICGMIAICAMILPGISGSFLLLILGAYQTVIGAISDKNLLIIAVFGSGCIVGLLSFSRALKWIFKQYNAITLSVLTGFLVGSVYKLWPWRHTEAIFVKHLGEENEEVVTLIDSPVWPNNYDRISRNGEFITNYIKTEPEILLCASLTLTGFALIFLMERFVNKNSN